MEVHERHRTGERSDAVSDPELEVDGPLGVEPFDDRVMRWE